MNLIQQQQTPSHRYVDIGGPEESSLVTSQYHIDHDSPKGDIPSTGRANTDSKYIESPIKIISNNSQQPQFTVVLKRFKAIQSLLKAIEAETQSREFQCINRQQGQLLLLRQLPASFTEKLQTIICSDYKNLKQSRNCLISIKVHHDVLYVKALSGVVQVTEEIINLIVKVIKRFQAPDVEEEIHQKDFELHHLEQDIYQNPYYLDASSIHLIYRHIKTKQIQEKINPTVQKVIENLKSITTFTNKKQLEKEIVTIGQLAQSLHEEILAQSNTNLTRTQNQPLYPYYRIALEKYLYEQIYPFAFPLYVKKFQEKEETAIIKRQQIKSKLNPQQMMEFLDIKQKFSTLSQAHIESYSNGIEILPPYFRSIRELEKINLMMSPREKLKCIQVECSDLWEADAVEFNPKEELVTMDDELPIIIYIMVMSEFKNQYAEVQFVDDFSNTDATIESERRVLTNLRVSLDYISNEW